MGICNVALMLGLIAGTSNAAPPEGPQAVLAKGINESGIALVAKLLPKSKDGNLVFSPYSAACAHLMLAYGSKGQDRAEVLKGFSIAGLKSDAEILESAGLSGAIEGIAGNPFTFANAFITIGEAKPVDEFLSNIRKSFGAEFFATKADEALDQINKWAAEKTKQRVPKLLDRLDIENGFALMNAATYDGEWVEPFDPYHSYPGEPANFTTGTGAKIVVDLMNRAQRPTPFYAGNGYEAVLLPYKDKAFSMLVVLPNAGSNPTAALGALAGGGWAKVLSGLKSEPVQVSMPKFEIRSSCDLIEPLRAMGVRRIFDGFNARGMATWPGIGPDQVVIDLQKAYIEVDEKGTKAAAVTVVGVMLGAAPAQPKRRFVADRPFVYAIVHNPTGALTFLGVCSTPPVAKSRKKLDVARPV